MHSKRNNEIVSRIVACVTVTGVTYLNVRRMRRSEAPSLGPPVALAYVLLHSSLLIHSVHQYKKLRVAMVKASDVVLIIVRCYFSCVHIVADFGRPVNRSLSSSPQQRPGLSQDAAVTS